MAKLDEVAQEQVVHPDEIWTPDEIDAYERFQALRSARIEEALAGESIRMTREKRVANVRRLAGYRDE